MSDEIPGRYILRDKDGKQVGLTREGEAWAEAHGMAPATPSKKAKSKGE